MKQPYYKLYDYLFMTDVESVILQKGNPLLGITQHPLPDGGWAVTVINYGAEPVEETLSLKSGYFFCSASTGNVICVSQESAKVSLTAGEMGIFTVK